MNIDTDDQLEIAASSFITSEQPISIVKGDG